MNTRTIVMVTREGWRQLQGGLLTELAPWPVLTQPTVVITDFDDAPVGSYRFDGGKPAYAAALIEKRARAEGLTDGAAHVIVHRVAALRDGLQTYHSVVPLESWQRMQQWAAEQRDHCIVMALGGILADGVGVGHARVLRSGRTMHFFSQTKAGMHYAVANALGRTDQDLLAAVRTLGGLTRTEVAKGVEHPVQFGSLMASSAEQDIAFAAHWASNSDRPAEPLPSEPAGPAASVLPGLLNHAGVRTAVNPPLARMAWWSERLVAGIATVMGILAIGLGALGYFAQDQARTERAAADTARRNAVALEARVTAVNASEIPQGFTPVAELARKLGDGARYDPVAMLALLRTAAGPGIRIQRLRLDAVPNQERGFQIDGVADGQGVGAIARLLTQLRAAGWNGQPVSATMDTGPGAFSYRLTMAAGPRG